MRDNALKRKLAAGEKAIGLWAGLGSPAALEMAAPVGFDWILIDCEHGESHTDDLAMHLRALTASDATTLVRVPTKDDPAIFKRVLDMGVEGVLVPQVYGADDVRAVVAACRYPPEGERGIAGGRAFRYGLDLRGGLEKANEEVLVAVQIETRPALDAIDEILAVPGLDAILIGPADLSAALGKPFAFDDKDIQGAISHIRERAKAAEVPVGIYCSSPAETARRLAEGFDFANACQDTSLLLAGYRTALQAAKSGDA